MPSHPIFNPPVSKVRLFASQVRLSRKIQIPNGGAGAGYEYTDHLSAEGHKLELEVDVESRLLLVRREGQVVRVTTFEGGLDFVPLEEAKDEETEKDAKPESEKPAEAESKPKEQPKPEQPKSGQQPPKK